MILSQCYYLVSKNTEKDDFEQQTACKAPIHWLKYTTLMGNAFILHNALDFYCKVYSMRLYTFRDYSKIAVLQGGLG